MDALTTWVALPLATVWAASETVLGRVTYRPEGRSADRGTLRLMIVATTLAAVSALAAWVAGVGRVAAPAGVLPSVGLALMVGGIGLRWTAILTLRRFFTINVAPLGEHRLVTHGVYRLLRHPAYTGTLLVLLGLGLALENAVSLLLVFGGPLAALLHRIRIEEAVLEGLFGQEYQDYRGRTWRLVPGLY